MKFETYIKDDRMYCRLHVSRDVCRPVLCYSALAPSYVVGHPRLRCIGGYSEIQLPDLQAGAPYDIQLAFDNDDFRPSNRAWLPLAAYLRCGTDCIALEKTSPIGVDPSLIHYDAGRQPVLAISPQPSAFNIASGHIHTHGFALDHPVAQACDQYFQRLGLGRILAADGVPVQIVDAAEMAQGAYQIDIATTEITIRHSCEMGLHYACVTLGSLLFNHHAKLPCGTIQDYPRFEWRGMHLDCARHFYSVDTILRYLDLMALFKFNRFHWHFADDETYRVVMERLPDLQRTHLRGENQVIPAVFGGGICSGGAYSRADVATIVEHAKSLHIEVLPEIEIPAHAYALCQVYPETRDPLDQGTALSVQGYAENVMNPAQTESWRIWTEMIQETADLFPFDMIHLGGDELPDHAWDGSDRVTDVMAQHGLANQHDVQGWIMGQAADIARAAGKTPCGWEESFRGSPNIGQDGVIFGWTGQGLGLQAARAGHRVVMMPGQHTYLDMAQTASVDDWGATWAAIIGLADTIAWDPVPTDEPELERNIIGVEGAFWSEFTTQDQDMEPMIAPRILGIATMAWSQRGAVAADDLFGLRSVYQPVFEKIGWRQS